VDGAPAFLLVLQQSPGTRDEILAPRLTDLKADVRVFESDQARHSAVAF
jgi:hypothetical protein